MEKIQTVKDNDLRSTIIIFVPNQPFPASFNLNDEGAVSLSQIDFLMPMPVVPLNIRSVFLFFIFNNFAISNYFYFCYLSTF
jgi:hypothetical protein